MLPRAALAGAACEVDEQRQVLAPQQLGRRCGAVHGHARGAEHADGEVGGVGHRAPIIGHGAVASKRRYILLPHASPSPSPALDDVQRAVGERYEVVSLAGAGGMGAVFRARHRTLGHIVAVKVLPPEVAASAMRRERFRREATLGAGLEHPNIVRVYDFDTREGITFLIMTFVRGATLEERLRDSDRPTTDAVLRTVREIADALGYVHRRGIVHRDVKPANILLDEDSGRALLADFGVAHVEGTADTSLTQPGVTIGTPGYMAPEQIAGGRVDGRADLYSLAAVAFEALTGTATDFRADRATLARALRAARPELSAREAAALVAPLAERPHERPTSGEAWTTASG